MGTWVRGQSAGLSYGRHNLLLARLSPGDSLMTIRFGIKADGFWTNPGAGSQIQIQASELNYTAFGIVTTVGNGTETPPSPVGTPVDAAPPTQRWVYLASSAMSLTTFSGTSSTWTMGFTANWEANRSEAQVLATGFTAPSALDVWLVIDTPDGAWLTPSPGDIAWYTVWWSLLRKL